MGAAWSVFGMEWMSMARQLSDFRTHQRERHQALPRCPGLGLSQRTAETHSPRRQAGFYIPGPDEGQVIGEEHESQSTRVTRLRGGLTWRRRSPLALLPGYTSRVLGCLRLAKRLHGV
ncbi:unnamed protein product [Arctogadus glacialis]